jgi:predicted nucleic acid-binding Zn ribbon protein
MESLQSTAPRALRALLDRQPTTPAKVTFAWQIAAGVTLGRATTPRWSEDGVLHVTARSAAWRREIDRARPTIAARLKELLGPGVVRAIVLDGPDDDKPAARRGIRRPDR